MNFSPCQVYRSCRVSSAALAKVEYLFSNMFLVYDSMQADERAVISSAPTKGWIDLWRFTFQKNHHEGVLAQRAGFGTLGSGCHWMFEE